jgi:hypothetical protein
MSALIMQQIEKELLDAGYSRRTVPYKRFYKLEKSLSTVKDIIARYSVILESDSYKISGSVIVNSTILCDKTAITNADDFDEAAMRVKSLVVQTYANCIAAQAAKDKGYILSKRGCYEQDVEGSITLRLTDEAIGSHVSYLYDADDDGVDELHTGVLLKFTDGSSQALSYITVRDNVDTWIDPQTDETIAHVYIITYRNLGKDQFQFTDPLPIALPDGEFEYPINVPLVAPVSQVSLVKTEAQLIQNYYDAWQQEANDIDYAIQAIQWDYIVDYDSASAEIHKLRLSVSQATAVNDAMAALREIKIESYDSRLSDVHSSKQFQAHETAIQGFRDACTRIEDYLKTKTKQQGKLKLSHLSKDATLEEYAIAMFESIGMVGNTGERIIASIRNRDGDDLYSILGNTSNKGSRAIFEYATKLTLPKTRSGTLAKVDEWLGITPEQRLEMDTLGTEKYNKELEQKRSLENLHSAWDVLKTKTNSDHGIESIQDLIIRKFGEGYVEISTSKKGAVLQYWLINSEGLVLGFKKYKPFNTFLKAARQYGGIEDGLKLSLVELGAIQNVPADEDVSDAEIDKLFGAKRD